MRALVLVLIASALLGVGSCGDPSSSEPPANAAALTAAPSTPVQTVPSPDEADLAPAERAAPPVSAESLERGSPH